jgi:hypothetical protein
MPHQDADYLCPISEKIAPAEQTSAGAFAFVALGLWLALA